MPDKYSRKAHEIISYCRKKRIKYKLFGALIIIGTALILFALAFTIKQYSLYFWFSLLIVPGMEAGIIERKISSTYAYQNQQIALLEKLQLEEELKQMD